MKKQRYLPVLLDGQLIFGDILPKDTLACAVLAWGKKPSAEQAERVSMRLALPLVRVEDGFIRSLEPGLADAALSAVVDDMGIYYDAGAPSRLELLIHRPLSEKERQRARALMQLWRDQRVSKYNHAPDPAAGTRAAFVLVVDQTRGDASIRYGQAGVHSFADMLNAALVENPDCEVLIKMHPEVMSGRKQGHFDAASRDLNPRVRLLGDDVHPVTLIQEARAVYVVTSQLGFEALLWGTPVRTFGMPFYAGWGLSQDEQTLARRGSVTLENLVHAALIDYAAYVHPESGQRCEVEAVIEWMGLQRRCRHRFGASVYACGFSRRKRSILRSYMDGSRVQFVRRQDKVPTGATRVLWGRRDSDGRGPVLRIEDGFLRSVGLGAALVQPLSWVIDDTGIYYDASCPSALENILNGIQLDASELRRAQQLQQAIIEANITKYNVGHGQWIRPPAATRVILVPGQVESDMSIRYGATDLRTNGGLLSAVRLANPDAWIVYKPHPDVSAGFRPAGVDDAGLAANCDEIIVDVGMGNLLRQVDEVHVLTSLTGFEALLRNKKVVCHGAPFYAGWGLTEDSAATVAALARRTRRLSLEELISGALIRYPSYISRSTGRHTTPERALQELVMWQNSDVRVSHWRQRLLLLWARMKG